MGGDGAVNTLETTDPTVIGERLRVARTRAGLTQDAAASDLKLARTTLIAIEKGQRRVRGDEIRGFASLYKTSVNTLLRPTSVQVDVIPRFRALLGAPTSSAAEAARLLNDLASAEVELERLLGQPLKLSYPAERPIGTGDIRELAEDAAMELRQRLGLGLAPIADMVSLLELELGVRVFVRPLAGNLSGLFVFDEELGACVLLNQHHPKTRRALTASHEIGHLLTARKEPDILDLGHAAQSREERFAKFFAPSLLMPAPMVRRRVQEFQRDTGRFSPRHLILLAHYFHVSDEAMCRRLEDLKLLRGGTWESLKERGYSGKLAFEVLGDRTTSEEIVMPPRLWLLASEAYQRSLLSEEQLARMLRMDVLEVRAMLDVVNGEQDDDFAAIFAS